MDRVHPTRGLSLYHPEAGREAPSVGFATADNMGATFQLGVIEAAPEAGLHDGGEAGPGRHIRVTFQGADKWKGTPADRLLYYYRLDSGAWSASSENASAIFDRLASGSHRVWVRAMDLNGSIRESRSAFTFQVIPTWYRSDRPIRKR